MALVLVVTKVATSKQRRIYRAGDQRAKTALPKSMQVMNRVRSPCHRASGFDKPAPLFEDGRGPKRLSLNGRKP